uniref:Uncharacterized protein n=1 Tax=Triticum urartu TaxID=4572 RepID=A0A8R7PNQ5_TRIUA
RRHPAQRSASSRHSIFLAVSSSRHSIVLSVSSSRDTSSRRPPLSTVHRAATPAVAGIPSRDLLLPLRPRSAESRIWWSEGVVERAPRSCRRPPSPSPSPWTVMEIPTTGVTLKLLPLLILDTPS